MRKLFSSFAIVFLVTLLTQKSFSQDSIPTEIFTLSTCDPINTIVKPSGKNTNVQKPFRLESKSKLASVLRITGVNPLRYRYFVNNEAVTQFMDASVIKISLNPFADGNTFAVAPEIKVPEIFKTEDFSSKVKTKIKEFQSTNKTLKDSIDFYNTKRLERWNSLLDMIATKNPSKAYRFYDSLAYASSMVDVEYKNISRKVDGHQKSYDQNLKEYEIFTSGLPLNNPKFGILEVYRNINLSTLMGGDLDSIRLYKREFAYDYVDHTARFKKIDSILFVLERKNRYDPDYTYLFSLLKENISYYYFTWKENRHSYGSYRTDADEIRENASDVREQILKKQFQLYEEFVLNLVTRIGVLVQNEFMDCSSFNNALENYTCIDNDTLIKVARFKSNLSKAFKFIQQTNAELQTLVPYLDINTDLYQAVAKNINSNYVYLLSYLKTLTIYLKRIPFSTLCLHIPI